MKGIYETTSDYSLSINKIAKDFSHKCLYAFHSINERVAQFKSRLALVMSMNSHSHALVNVKHLHKSYYNLQPHKRNIFTLYVKGYEISEICAKSGAKRSQITYIVHSTIKDLPKQDYLS